MKLAHDRGKNSVHEDQPQQISTDLTAQKLQNHVHTLFILGYHIVIILFTSQSSEFPFYKLYLNMKEALHREVGQAGNISFS